MIPNFPSGEWANPAQSWWSRLEAWRDDSVLAALRSEASQGRAQRSVYDLFQEMEDKDGHLYAVLQTRKNGVLARDRAVIPADDSPEARQAADLVRKVLEETPGFEQGLMSLLDALAKGFAAAELIWERRPDGRIGLGGMRGRPQSIFGFGPGGAPLLLSPWDSIPGAAPLDAAGGHAGAGGEARTGDWRAGGAAMAGAFPGGGLAHGAARPLPPGKFAILTYGSPHSNPYGKGLCLKCYWYYWFKKHNLKFWAIYNERFGAPAVLGKYGPGTSEEERQRLLEVIEALQSDTGVTLPDHIRLEFLEARRSGDGRTYREFADWCNDEMSKVVLGATLTASEGRRSGSLALGEVHQTVRSEYIEADAKILSECINRQVIPWIVRFNLGEGVAPPVWKIDTQPDENLPAEAEVDRALVGLGVPLPLSHFYARYRRPAPHPGEKTLRYDDNNLYQYHLQFGVLTINEVRASLGLAPVAWGDSPPHLAQETSRDAGRNTARSAGAGTGAGGAEAPSAWRSSGGPARDPQEITGEGAEEAVPRNV